MKRIILSVCSVMLCVLMAFSVGCGENDNLNGGLTYVSSGSVADKPEVSFDDDNVIFKIGVISDVHMSYSYHSEQDIANNIKKYASAAGAFYRLSGGKLDGMMMCGDYTSTGCDEQAKTFADATKVVFNDIFGENCPEILIGMGNHDTSWGGCMEPQGWYNLLSEYGLTKDYESDSDIVEGNIHIKLENGDKSFHLLFIETETYAGNTFSTKTVLWLGQMLDKLTKENPNQYVFVGTHGPVMETGIYGTNIELEGGANWATSQDNIHHILKQYPQVVLFNGHTHFSEYLETTIMQKEYTALGVSALFSQSFYNSQYTKYIDSPVIAGGMAYYIEIDINGNQKIQRVDFSKTGEMATAEIKSTATVPNPAYGGKDEPQNIAIARTKSATLTSNTQVVIHGNDWVIPAPDSEKNHLKYYGMDRGNVEKPEFLDEGGVFISSAKRDGMTIYFPAAKSDVYILQYVIRIFNENGDLVHSIKTLGNWCDITSGIGDGTSHRDARSFIYSIPVNLAKGRYMVDVYAVDEYGNRGNSIGSDYVDVR